MRIGCSTMCFGNADVVTALRAATDAGYASVDLAAIREIAPHVDVIDRPADQRARLRDAVQAAGVLVDALICVPWYPDALLDDAELARRYTELADVAASVGAHVLIVDANRLREGEERAEAVRRLRRVTAMAADIAGSRGVTLAVEVPHPFTLAKTLPEAVDLLGEIGIDGLGIDFDVSHVHNSGADMAQAMEVFGDRIVHVALRDVLGPGRFGVPGDGVIDFEAVVSALDRVGYTGPLVAELEPDDTVPMADRQAAAARALDYVTTLLVQRRGGSAQPG